MIELIATMNNRGHIQGTPTNLAPQVEIQGSTSTATAEIWEETLDKGLAHGDTCMEPLQMVMPPR